MRIALTGGGGFIGSRLVRAMVDGGHDVTLIGSSVGRSQGTASLVEEGRVRFVQCDAECRERSRLARALLGVERLVLLGYTPAAEDDAVARMLHEIEVNVAANLRLIEAADRTLGHVIFASSVSVYGTPRGEPARETDAAAPEAPYALGKLVCEQSLSLLAAERGVTTGILRYATVYGPGETVRRAVPSFIRAALAGGPLWVDGDGLDEHDYVYLDDVVAATLAAVAHCAKGIFNIGTGVGTTTLALARMILDLTGSQAELSHRPAPSGRSGRLRVVCATEAARGTFGFVARTSLRDGLRAAIDSYKGSAAAAEAVGVP